MMNGPLRPWGDAFDGHEWIGIMWSYYDEMCDYWEKRDLPRYIEGDDIFQDLVEKWLADGLPEAVDELTPEFTKNAGRFHSTHLIEKEKGRQSFGDRVFVPIESVKLLYTKPDGTPWLMEEEGEIGDEVRARMTHCNERQHQAMCMKYALGYKVSEIAEVMGVHRVTVQTWLREGRQAAREVDYEPRVPDTGGVVPDE